jgi:hypothetical protein
MKILVWTKITDQGDGSQSVDLFATREEAVEGLDDELFEIDDKYSDAPCQVEYSYLETFGCEVLK